MSEEPRDELRAVIEGLSEEQARTLLAWTVVLRRDQRRQEGEQSVGPLGDVLGMRSVGRGPGWSKMELTVDPAWANPNGVLHGGIVYTLIDYGMGGAVQPNLPEGDFCTSIEVKVSYLVAVRDGVLTAETKVLKEGRNVAFLESKVTDGQGRLVATATGSMFVFRGEGRE
jgi:uncharacterized protein (TIGR00369 family)